MSAVASGSILIATPMLDDPNFRHTVVYVVEHGPDGTLGLIVNRALDAELGDIWEGCPAQLCERRCCAQGGPVEPGKGLLVHGFDNIEGATPFCAGAWIGGDVDAICHRLQNDDGDHGPRLYLGHAGWEEHQLLGELAHGAWIVRPGASSMLTCAQPPDDFWQSCAIAGSPPHQPCSN